MSGDVEVRRREHRHVLDDVQQIPENELDVVIVPNSIDHSKHVSRVTQIIMVIALPLTFLISFSLCYTSALHAPSPHDFPLVVAGPNSVTAMLGNRIRTDSEGAFDVTRTTNSALARSWVERRQTAGAIVLEGNRVTAVVATGGGAIIAKTVEKVADEVATGLGGTMVVDDVAPLPDGDMAGVGIFYMVLISAIGGYLALGAVKQISRTAGIVQQLITATVASIVVPIITMAMVTAFVGDFGVTFGPMAGTLGVLMISTFTVCLMRMLLNRVLGQAGIFAAIILVMAINLPSMGGTIPEPMLPGFWQAVHDIWFGAGAQEAVRSIIYFHGHQFGRWFAQLVIWTGTLIAANVGLEVLHRRRSSRLAPPQASPEQRPPIAAEAAALV